MSSTELAVYNRIADPMAAVAQLGTAIAKSRMFGCDSIEQGQVMALECISRGIPPLTLADRYHVVQGKLMMKYDAMLAEFRERGGKHKIISRTADKAEIELSFDGQTIRESLTWEEAQQEKYPFGKDGKVKDNWGTPRGRRQMLWARVVSEGVRSFMPEVNHGRYVPEEFGEIVDADTNGHSNGSTNGHTVATESGDVDENGDVVDAEFTVADKPKEEQPAKPVLCTRTQKNRVKELFDTLGATEGVRAKTLQKRDVKEIKHLTREQAQELIAALEGKLAAVADGLAGESKQPEDATEAYDWSPCSEVLVQQIKAELTGCQDPALVQSVVAHLGGQGKEVADLTTTDATELLNSLQVKNLEAFFAKSLETSREVATGAVDPI